MTNQMRSDGWFKKENTKKTGIWFGLLLLVLLMGFNAVKAEAAGKDWMSTAEAIRFDEVTTGVARKTDWTGTYYKYFVMTVPDNMTLTLNCTGNGTRPFYTVAIYDQSGKTVEEFWHDDACWSYNPYNNMSKMKGTVTLRKGIYYFRLYNCYDSKTVVNWKFWINGSLTKAPAITSIKRKGKKAAVIRLNGIRGASGYQIFMRKGNGRYKLIATTNQRMYVKKGLKRKAKYYFMVRAYRTIGGRKMFTPFSYARKIKMK